MASAAGSARTNACSSTSASSRCSTCDCALGKASAQPWPRACCSAPCRYAAPSVARLRDGTEGGLLLVRHGESTWNRSRRVQGQTAHPRLTRRGRAQARALAATLGPLEVTRILTSDCGARPRRRPSSASPWGSPRSRRRCSASATGTRGRAAPDVPPKHRRTPSRPTNASPAVSRSATCASGWKACRGSSAIRSGSSYSSRTAT
ncbi:hypothetical protein EFL26_13420 [Nocardioides pocheonensis]|uniref:Histidine phosphatase family protein n=1 Tax=Nocardioides pocheonensis TaxID=661485 RepID=A0A3N0GNZ6_9ACTN|nr:hypothetical protein EFL26_13420 [Nocardioides pocheonensis]